MIKINATIAAAMAALFLLGNALAATPEAEAGNEPYESGMAVTNSPVTRGAVEAQAADPQSTLTRQAVEREATMQEPAAGQGPFESK